MKCRVVCSVVFLRVVHVLGSRERLQGPVEEAVEKDEARTSSPDHQNHYEGHTKVIDHLQKEITHDQYLFLFMP